ncbi:TPA: permease [archaeon]|nr:permease [Candidatus Naiadarchaeales archaeon SRR2090159.bin1288]
MKPTKYLQHIEVNWIPLAMFSIVIGIYAALLATRPDVFRLALSIWTGQFVFFLPFVVAIIGLLGIFDAFVSPGTVSKHLGDKKRAEGYIFAVLFGSVVSAAQYAVFPTIKLLKKHGARSAVLATFMVAWSGISLPLIPLEVEIFGAKFVFVRLAVIAIGAVAFGVITGLLKVHIDP